MKDLILVITAMCILGGTLMANTPAENIQDDESPQERELKASVRAWKAKEKAKAAAKE